MEVQDDVWKKGKRKPDERLEKESNVLAAKMFYVITPLLVISLIVKLVCRLPFQVYVLELLCLLASGGYFLVQEIGKGILLVRKKDEALLEIHRAALSRAFMIDFWLLVIGELVYIYAVKDYFWWVLPYMAAWLLPGLVITIASIKQGWLVRSAKAQGKAGSRSSLILVIIGAAVFGILMGFPEFYHDGAFHAEGLLYMLGMGAGWGILYYFMMNGFIRKSEKHADKRLEGTDDDEE